MIITAFCRIDDVLQDLVRRATFARQAANLWRVKEPVWQMLWMPSRMTRPWRWWTVLRFPHPFRRVRVMDSWHLRAIAAIMLKLARRVN